VILLTPKLLRHYGWGFKGYLKDYGNEPKDWEIYRGDSFQLIINPVDVTRNCLVNQGRYQTTQKRLMFVQQ
jgi:hypothetical protein